MCCGGEVTADSESSTDFAAAKGVEKEETERRRFERERERVAEAAIPSLVKRIKHGIASKNCH